MITFLQSLILIFAPFYIIREHFFIPITLLEILILSYVFLTILEAFKLKAGIKEFRTHFDLLILLFLMIAFLETYISYDFVGGLGILKAYFIEPILFFYCLTFNSRKSGLIPIIYSLLISGIWLSALSIIQKLTGQFSLAPNELAIGRVTAVFNSANSLALYLGPIIILSLASYLNKKQILKLLLMGLFLLAFFWTRSRGGLIALVISLLIFSYEVFILKGEYIKNKFIRFFSKSWYLIPAVLLIIFSLFLINFYQTTNFIPADYGQPYTNGDTLQIRYFIWAGTINMLRDHPFFGAGLNGFKTLYTNQYRLTQYQEEFQYPHNLFLTFWAETGILGLLIFLLIIVESFGLVIKKIKTHKNPFLGIGFLTILCYWLIHGLVDVPYFKNDLSVEFWVVIALIEIWLSWKSSSHFDQLD